MVKGYKIQCGTGVTTLLNVVHQMSIAVHRLHEKGFTIDQLLTTLETAARVCEEKCDEFKIYLPDSQPKDTLQRLGEALGSSVEVDLARAVAERICAAWNTRNVKVHKVQSCSKHSKILDGLLLPITPDEVGDVRLTLSKLNSNRVGLGNSSDRVIISHSALIYGDVFVSQDRCLSRIRQTFERNPIDLLIIFGEIDNPIQDICTEFNVIVVSGITKFTADAVAKLTGTLVVEAVWELGSFCLGRDPVALDVVEVGVISKDADVVFDSRVINYGIDRDKNYWLHIQPWKVQDEPYVSVLLTHPVASYLDEQEFQFWKYLYRLRNALQTQCVLPGKSSVLLSYSNVLHELAVDSEIYQTLSECLDAVVETIYLNLGFETTDAITAVDQAKIKLQDMDLFDDFLSRKYLMTRACSIIQMVLQSEKTLVNIEKT